MYNTLLGGVSNKRNVFFSFHYEDIMRVNNVRNSGQFKTESTTDERSIEGFYDYSLWESRKTNGPDSVKQLIREGVDRTSAVCVLIGSQTWQRRWVRYEIARSVIDGRGLIGVHINGLKHHKPPYQSHQLGENPLRYLGVARQSSNDKFYLCERVQKGNNEYEWAWYKEHTQPVNVPRYMDTPTQNSPIRLSDCAKVFDWMQNGHNQIGNWIDAAAIAVGR